MKNISFFTFFIFSFLSYAGEVGGGGGPRVGANFYISSHGISLSSQHPLVSSSNQVLLNIKDNVTESSVIFSEYSTSLKESQLSLREYFSKKTVNIAEVYMLSGDKLTADFHDLNKVKISEIDSLYLDDGQEYTVSHLANILKNKSYLEVKNQLKPELTK